MTALRAFANKHPNLIAWLVLAIGMVGVLIWAARDVALLPTQMATLILSTILLAGLCVWIVNWE